MFFLLSGSYLQGRESNLCLILTKSVNNVAMKTRNCVTLLVAAIFVAALLCVMPRDITFLLPEAEQYYVFCRGYDGESFDNGVSKAVQVTDDVDEVLFACRYVDGVTAVLPAETDVDRLLSRLHATVVFSQSLGSITEYCCISPLVKGGVSVDGSRVNVQIAVTDTAVYVGSPLILGAY